MKEVLPKKSIEACVRMPGSKSLIHRVLVAAGLASGKSSLSGFLQCEDTLYTISALQELGIGISVRGESVTVSGTGAVFPLRTGIRQIFLGNSGTSYRILLSTAALTQGHYILTGDSRMLERPVGELVRALKEVGVEVSCMGTKGVPPVFIKAKGIRGGRVSIEGDKSSQYVSSLLLAAPYMEKGVEIEVKGKLVSSGYVDLTVDVMQRFGVAVVREGYEYFKASSDHGYEACPLTIEGDVSSASYFWAAAAVTGGKVTTENVYPFSTRQGDIRFLQILEEMGSKIDRNGDHVIVRGGTLSGIEADMRSMPDMVPTLAAIALFADGKTSIRNVPHLRLKESDRLNSIARELSRLGGLVDELHDGLVIHGGSTLSGAVVDPHDDHRIAMSLAIVGLRVPGIKIDSERCVKKSFPQFWDVWDSL